MAISGPVLNPSMVLHGVGDLRIEERPVPDITDTEALVAVCKTGICGSDVHYLNHGGIGSFVMEAPMCLGHESAGTVVAVGAAAAAASGISVGDRVALEPGIGCGICDLCKAGKYELCAKMVFAATPPNTCGTLARYYALPADLLHRLPDNVSFEEGAMMEPLAVGVHSVKTLGQCSTNQTVIVFGAGPVGLLCMAVAKALGARRIIAVDIMQDKLDFAKGFAASDTFLPLPRGKEETPENHAVRMTTLLIEQLGLTRDGGVDLAIEASGAPSCVQIGCMALKSGGRYVQVGMGSQMNVTMPLFHIISKELQILGSFRYGPGAYPLAISLVERGLVDVKALITQRYPFEDGIAAFEATKAGKDATGKPVIKCIIDGPL